MVETVLIADRVAGRPPVGNVCVLTTLGGNNGAETLGIGRVVAQEQVKFV